MNAPLLTLGCAFLVGSAVHAVLGERYIIAPLKPDALPLSFLGDGDTTKRYLRWFWHVGTVAIGGGGLALSTCALDLLSEGVVVARAVSIQYLAMFAAFLVVAVPRPALFHRVPQGTLMGVGGALAWLAA